MRLLLILAQLLVQQYLYNRSSVNLAQGTPPASPRNEKLELGSERFWFSGQGDI